MGYNTPTAFYTCCNPLHYHIGLKLGYRHVTGIATVTTTNQLFHVLLMQWSLRGANQKVCLFIRIPIQVKGRM
jgi:hypothetical protein